ncbi:MAG TPA: helix-turn-helix transcriptional regulator [Allosphingosinicella sp.]
MSREPQTFSAPDGTEMVILPAAEYARLKLLAEEGQDVSDSHLILARIERGEGTMPGEVLGMILDEGMAPLAAWRRHRGLSQAALARKSGLSQVWISRIESAGGYGSRETRRKLALALDAPVWALEDEGKNEAAAPARPHGGRGPGAARKVTAEEIAKRYGLNPKSYRAALREEQLPWHHKHERWTVEPDSPEEARMLSIARKLSRRG